METNSVYIKIPEYMIPYLRFKYGTPMTYSPLSIYQTIISTNLVRNKMLTMRSANISFSAYAVSISKKYSLLSERERNSVPSPSQLSHLLQVKIPNETMGLRDGIKQMVQTDKFFQLTVMGARAFRKATARDFWSALYEWVKYGGDDIRGGLSGLNVRITQMDLVQKFMDYYGIDVVYLETICRNFRRLEHYKSNKLLKKTKTKPF